MLLYFNESTGVSIDYVNLYRELCSRKKCPKYIYTKDTLVVIKNIVYAILNGLDIVLLDGDFTETELKNLGIDRKDLDYIYDVDFPVQINCDSCITDIIISKQDITHIGIYTSGTTGLPKRFDHSLRSLLRNIKINDSHKSDVWAFAYNITHYAGVQVLLQSILNLNSIIDVFGENARHADVIIKEYGCTCISATPTFYRNFLLPIAGCNEKIKSVTFGGEKFSNELLKRVKVKFPNAKIRNVYASTEVGSLLSGRGESFSIPQNMVNVIKISDEGHLLLHRSIVHNISVENEWYDTGDVVSLNTDGTFKFLSRDSDFINVGGYKVNPYEVESIILKVPGVVDVAVYGRENSVTGKLLVADIVVDDSYDPRNVKITITESVRKNLQIFKVPRIIKVVNEIKKSRSGKKVR